MKPDVIFFGMQGSGKGTQASLLKEHFQYQVFDTGSALRSIVEQGSTLGEKVKKIIESGNLVPTEVVMEVVENFIKENNNQSSIIFDGIPRNEDQQLQFDALMNKVGRKPVAIYISLTRDEAIERLLKRRICPKCKKIFGAKYEESVCDFCGTSLIIRSDDNEDAIKQRIDVFLEHTVPIIEVYKNEGRYIEIDGRPSVIECFEKIKHELKLND